MPSIKDVVASQRAVPTQEIPSNSTQPTAQETSPETSPSPNTTETGTSAPQNPDSPTPTETASSTVKTTPVEDETFESCWKTLFDELFSSNHLIYYNLKDEIPRYENDTIHIEVKNGIQKEQFEMRKKAIVEYWRNHFSLNVDDIEITANEHKEEKRVIISADDKFRNMTEQNAMLPEFLNILGFRMKD